MCVRLSFSGVSVAITAEAKLEFKHSFRWTLSSNDQQILSSFYFLKKKCDRCRLKKSVRDDSSFAGSKSFHSATNTFLVEMVSKDSLTVMESEE
ncbi:hypothetical protein OS493_017464 [Desmophyllum pertusum]|uniref:Uncharacterized protein n=1 Tax=Desmophyllum pertusum TaxID=174260 RepID=A0A9W9ZNR6_9CNID|nr:hypothetical protein OS493_017464 [Desmophyllum pertusum]